MAQGAARSPLSSPEVEQLRESIRRLLDDPDANLSRDARLRWEVALTAVEAILGEPSSLVRDDRDQIGL